jgi:hypothetical protein
MRATSAAMFGTFVLTLASLASAANIDVTNVTRTSDGHGEGHKLDISKKDCDAAEEFTFPYTITGTLTDIDTLEVWIGEGSVSCNLNDERNGSNAQCEQVYATASPKQNGELVLTAQQIATGLSNVGDDCVDAGLNPDARDANVWFLLVRSTGTDVAEGDYLTWADGKVDLLPPTGPTDLVLKQLDSGLQVEFTPSTDSSDAFGYNAYCDPPSSTVPSAVAATGAGGGTSGAGGAGGGSGSDCTSSLLTPGTEPNTLACGEATGTTVSSVTANGLDNGTSYAIAVTARDAVGNESVLSELLCGEPKPVDDFFTVYRDAGGEGGGGYCTIAGVRLGAGDIGLVAAFVAAGGALAYRRRRARRRAAAAVGASALVALFAWPSAAHAQSHIPDTNWRQSSRPNEQPADTQFAFEIRFGPYWPAVDDEPALGGRTPYADTFGDAPRFYFGLEFDWMPLRIPYVGMFGPGFGWGYTWSSEKARLTGCTGSGTDCQSDDITSLTIMPMHLSAVLRGDELMRRTGVPFVPYAKFGPAVGVWSAAKSSGDAKVTVNGEDISGEGATWGLNLALGGMLALNWLDTGSAGRLRETTGIGHVYLFGEWMDAMLTGLGAGSQMYVGSSTFVCGLAGDF